MTAPSDFDSLVRETRPQLVRFLTRMVGAVDAEDVTQAALSKASAAFSSFRGQASPRTWLFRIAANAARDRLRSHRQLEAVDDEDEAREPDDSSQDASQERRLVREEMSKCVDELFARLPESYQTLLALSDCEELSDREIASILDVTEGAAKIRLHRARSRLKLELSTGCSFYRDDQNVFCCDRKQH